MVSKLLDILRGRDAKPEPEQAEREVMVMTGRQARVLLGMPGRLINKARVEPIDWRGQMVKVVGL